jgi:hypothetical protein
VHKALSRGRFVAESLFLTRTPIHWPSYTFYKQPFLPLSLTTPVWWDPLVSQEGGQIENFIPSLALCESVLLTFGGEKAAPFAFVAPSGFASWEKTEGAEMLAQGLRYVLLAPESPEILAKSIARTAIEASLKSIKF